MLRQEVSNNRALLNSIRSEESSLLRSHANAILPAAPEFPGSGSRAVARRFHLAARIVVETRKANGRCLGRYRYRSLGAPSRRTTFILHRSPRRNHLATVPPILLSQLVSEIVALTRPRAGPFRESRPSLPIFIVHRAPFAPPPPHHRAHTLIFHGRATRRFVSSRSRFFFICSLPTLFLLSVTDFVRPSVVRYERRTPGSGEDVARRKGDGCEFRRARSDTNLESDDDGTGRKEWTEEERGDLGER